MSDGGIAALESELIVCELPVEVSTLVAEPAFGIVGAFIFSTVGRAPAKDVLIAQKEFGGEGVRGQGEGSASRGAFLEEDGVEFAHSVLLRPEKGADAAELFLVALGFGLRGEDGRSSAFSALEGGARNSAGSSARPIAFAVGEEDGDGGEFDRRRLFRGGHEGSAG